MASVKVPPHARAAAAARGHRFAAYPRCSADNRGGLERTLSRRRASLAYLVALIVALLPAEVGGARLTAAQVRQLVADKGAREAIHYIFVDLQAENALAEGIATGGDGWLRAAALLRPGSDAASAELLTDAIQEALPKNPRGVLRLVQQGIFDVGHACEGYGFGQIEDERPLRVQIRLVDRRVRAVSALQSSSLAPVRKACLGELAFLKQSIIKHHGRSQ